MRNLILRLVEGNGYIRQKVINFSRLLLRRNGIFATDLSRDSRKNLLQVIENVRQEAPLLLSDAEAYILCIAVLATSKVNASIAEVGVYRGGSARLIAELKGERKLFLFDTFAGLPELHAFDTSNEFFKGQFEETSFESVSHLLAPFSHVEIYRGMFPETAGPIENEVFSFVHLDVDLYQSTHDSLELFYPRLKKGGIIITHDYINADGVRKAFDDFFSDKPEVLLPISESQCLVVKT